VRAFPHVEDRAVLYAYGDNIYNPSNIEVPSWLLAHEAVHSLQQFESDGAEIWWERYIASPDFRIGMEIEAHCVEVQQFNTCHSRAIRRGYALGCAERLSGDLYGNLISPRRARKIINQWGKQCSL
jgi:hypothetical protein